ncbi:MAG TPA: sialidase family protein [Candidatus Brocadiia bacterium]|nr:sialidase family protein [Candidatus Brocadiia bacterium]
MIAAIEKQVIFEGRKGGTAWFHPRACRVPASGGAYILMTCQPITGSDVFGQVHWTITRDNGKTWTQPEPINALERTTMPDGLENGVCDIVPEYHARTNTVLAMGHNVYYKDNVLARPSEGRYAVYCVRDAGGNWGPLQRLEWDDPDATAIYTCGCAQRVTMENGDVLVALSFGPKGRPDRMVGSVLCSFDGKRMAVLESGNKLELSVKRGLLEPSLAFHDGRYYMTIRAEDNRGYVSVSDGGLRWAPQKPWAWDDGEALTMSTTQQRWLPRGDALFLVYTRKDALNINVMRWRSPLYVAQVDTKRLCLIRGTERVALPLIGDGVNNAKHVAHMGNFHTVAASREESWVTVGEILPDDGWSGDTLMARIRWERPNTLVEN